MPAPAGNAPFCPAHGVQAVWKEGVNKDTGKPYAFYACPEKDGGQFCKAKIPQPPKTSAGSTAQVAKRETQVVAHNSKEQDERMIRAQLCSAAIQKGLEPGFDTWVKLSKFLEWSMGNMPVAPGSGNAFAPKELPPEPLPSGDTMSLEELNNLF